MNEECERFAGAEKCGRRMIRSSSEKFRAAECNEANGVGGFDWLRVSHGY